MVIRGFKLTGKQPATIDIPQRGHSTVARFHYDYIGMSELR